MVKKVLFDCDIGIDDSLALLYLLSNPVVEIVGIIATAGNVSQKHVERNALNWLNLTRNTQIPVYSGASVPLNSPFTSTEETHGNQGIGYASLPESNLSAQEISGVDGWIRIIEENPGEIIGIITGPTTTFAQAITKNPDIIKKLNSLIIMGGAFNHPGNTTPVAEWNVAWDPEALALVCENYYKFSNEIDYLPIFCPLDITETIILTPDHIEQLCIKSDTKVEKLDFNNIHIPSENPNILIKHITDMLRFYFEFHNSQGYGHISHIHDPFAAWVAVNQNNSATKITKTRVDVELIGKITRAKTVADWKNNWDKSYNAQIVTEVDDKLFFEEFIHSISNLCKQFN